jgi:hypothetical protein
MVWEIVLDTKAVEGIQSEKAGEVVFGSGLLIGSILAPEKVAVCAFVSTPLPPAGITVVGSVWASQHAQYVRRMLGGGASVIGCYHYGTADSLRTRHQQLIECARGIRADSAGSACFVVSIEVGGQRISGQCLETGDVRLMLS